MLEDLSNSRLQFQLIFNYKSVTRQTFPLITWTIFLTFIENYASKNLRPLGEPDISSQEYNDILRIGSL